MTKEVIEHVMTKHSLTIDEVLNLLEEIDEVLNFLSAEEIDEVLNLLGTEEAQEEKED